MISASNQLKPLKEQVCNGLPEKLNDIINFFNHSKGYQLKNQISYETSQRRSDCDPR